MVHELITVVLAGGKGTRLLPATKATNKHLLPIYKWPMIFRPLKAGYAVGCRRFLVVSGEDHIGPVVQTVDPDDPALDMPGADIAFLRQKGSGGIAAAHYLTKNWVGNCPQLVFLGDNDVLGKFIKRGVQRFFEEQKGVGAMVFFVEVPDPERFGVPVFEGEPGKSRLVAIEEKPKNPKSRYAAIGVYLYDADVFKIIEQQRPSGRGELEITDVNNEYLRRGLLTYEIYDGTWTDAGTPDSLLRASIFGAMREHGMTDPHKLVDHVLGPITEEELSEE